MVRGKITAWPFVLLFWSRVNTNPSGAIMVQQWNNYILNAIAFSLSVILPQHCFSHVFFNSCVFAASARTWTTLVTSTDRTGPEPIISVGFISEFPSEWQLLVPDQQRHCFPWRWVSADSPFSFGEWVWYTNTNIFPRKFWKCAASFPSCKNNPEELFRNCFVGVTDGIQYLEWNDKWWEAGELWETQASTSVRELHWYLLELKKKNGWSMVA